MIKDAAPYKSLQIITVAMTLPFLILLSACTGLELLATEQPDLTDETVIRQRIQNGFDEMLLSTKFRVRMDNMQPYSETVDGFTLTTPITLEVADREPHSGYMITARIVAEGWESIHIGTMNINESQMWIRTDHGWQSLTQERDLALGAFMVAGLGNPYVQIWDPPSNLTFRSRHIRNQIMPFGEAEIYEVHQEIPQTDGTVSISNLTEVWIDADTGYPRMSIYQGYTLTYEIDESIEIELP